jgi:phenylpropionate dioxygenase-like ring-hydroxylating dioxygenase large terminal subunit
MRTNAPYSGYYNRRPQDEDPLLTRVGPGTPCGEYLRRYWHPFMLASELKDLPVAVRLLGEDLVIFRDQSGRVGLLHRHCAHRGASLEFGIPAERGIRCCYHGWQFDVDGTILDTPAEPTDRIKSRFIQGAYHVREAYGLLFAYMGPPESLPEFPIYDSFEYPDDNRLVPFNMHLPCNWLQIIENAADPIHNAFLHAIVSGQQFSAAFKVLPQLDFPETPLGFLSMATRKVKDFVFVRASDIILPNVGQFPSGGNMVEQESFGIRPFLTRWAVPVDDTNSFYIGFCHLNSYNHSWIRSVRPEDYGVDRIPFIGQTGDRPYEERQREPGDYDAVSSQGPIANRKAEHLGTADRGVVLIRRMLAKAIAAMQAGETPAMPRLYPQGPVRTYAHEAVVRIPADMNLDDPKALAEFGRRVAAVFIESDGVPPEERDQVAEAKIRRLFEAATAG